MRIVRLYLLIFGLVEPFIYPKAFWFAVTPQSIEGGGVTAKKLVEFTVILLLLDVSFELKHFGKFFIRNQFKWLPQIEEAKTYSKLRPFGNDLPYLL